MFLSIRKHFNERRYEINYKKNVPPPYGKYKTAAILDTENINAEVTYSEYSNCYFDSPYRHLTKTANFTTYTGTIFNDNNQIELAKFFQNFQIPTQ